MTSQNYDIFTQVDNVDVEELGASRQSLYPFIVDCSGSMNSNENAMRVGLATLKQEIVNSKQEDEILISMIHFGSSIRVGGYQIASDLDTTYSANDDTTRLFDAIIEAKERLFNENGTGYYQQLVASGISVKVILTILSDGMDNNSIHSISEAKEALEFLKTKEVILTFISFGKSAEGIAKNLGITEVLDIQDATPTKLKEVMKIYSKSVHSSSRKSSKQVAAEGFFVV